MLQNAENTILKNLSAKRLIVLTKNSLQNLQKFVLKASKNEIKILTVGVKLLPPPRGLICPRKIFMKRNSVHWGRVQESSLKPRGGE